MAKKKTSRKKRAAKKKPAPVYGARPHHVELTCPVHTSFRVEKVSSLFDVARSKKARHVLDAELPDPDADWRIGAIVGPSGSGKSTLAAAAYGDALYRPGRWPKDKAVIDAVGEGSFAEVSGMLTAVGFSSPPSWVKPYHVLSGGEQFRCDLARALLRRQPLTVFDEFTSVVDRQVAKIGSAAVAKALRKGRAAGRFVAVTCHYDILEWLCPDWTLDLASGRLARSRLRRPDIELTLHEGSRTGWPLFAKYHYMRPTINTASRMLYGLVDGRPVACASVQFDISNLAPHAGKNWPTRRRIGRLVVLPDFQGVGIGQTMFRLVGQQIASEGEQAYATTAHPGLIHYLNRSPDWRVTRIGTSNPRLSNFGRQKGSRYRSSGVRPTATAFYVGPKD